MKTTITSMDFFGRGIASLDKKTFVRDALPGEDVQIKITKTHKNYDEAEVVELYKINPKRVKSRCPYYPKCGGCTLRNLSYDDSLEYKLENIKQILKDYIDEKTKINLISNKEKLRNKVTFKVVNSRLGFYEVKSNNLIEIDKCLNVKECINMIIPDLKTLNIINGEIMVRANYNNSLLISINSRETIYIKSLLENKNIAGIIYNDKVLYGKDYFYEQINEYKFKVSYKSFFQVSNYINSQIFNILSKEVEANSNVLDLCCGVGSLSIASNKARCVLGIEINTSSISDANYNARLNNIKNVKFVKGDAFAKLKNLNNKYDTLIVDPPRSGIKKKAVNDILNANFKKIIYISCNPITLKRDLNMLCSMYRIKKIYVLDMFSFTYHAEILCTLERR